MSCFSFNNVKIKGISATIPKNEKSLLNEKNLYNGDEKRINRVIKSSGFLNRRIVDENTTASDLCFNSAKYLIDKLSIDKSTIDGLLFLSSTPDYFLPATSYVLHSRLGLSENCICMDIPQACSGYVLGLFQSCMLLNSGCKRILLLVGDTFSKFSDMFSDNTAPVFGDAGSATIVDYENNLDTFYFNINSNGNGYENLVCRNGGFRNIPKQDMFYENESFMYNSKMNGGKIFDFTMNNIVPSIIDLLEHSNRDIKDFDYYVFHQANKFILENLARQLEIDISKMPMETLTKYGNQCGASIPCAILDKLPNLIQNKNVLMSGFGAGLSWANAIVQFKDVYCSELLVYEG